jgi:hypothetical protein
MKSYRNIIFILVTVLAVLTQLSNSTLAYADGETDPPPPTEVAVEPPPPTEEPATEVPLTGEIPAEAPVATEVPGVADTPLVDPIVAEEPALLEILGELPVETGVVVLNESGEAVPLVTQEAADIIVNGDPIWCPTGVNPGGLGCSPSYNYFTVEDDGTTSGGLVGWLNDVVNAATVSQAGKIWIADSYSSATHGSSDIAIDGAFVAGTMENFALTLQGGWNGVLDGSGIITATNSVFSVPITVTNWNAAVTVNNITINNTAGDGLTITSSKDVTITNSVFANNDGSGVYMYDVGAVTITDSVFSGNADAGFDLGMSSGSVSIKNSTFSVNTGDGANISGMSVAGNVAITGSTFGQNGGDGAVIYNPDGATVTDSTFEGNNANGVSLLNPGTASISNNTFNGNLEAGLYLETYEGSYTSAAIAENIFSQNKIGIKVEADLSSSIMPDGSSDLNLKCNTFRGNGLDISTSGKVTVTNALCGNPDPPLILSSSNFVNLVIDCSLDDNFLVEWASGDQIVLSCLDGGTARLSRIENTMLPRDMPAGFEYASGFLIEIFQDGVPLNVLADGGFVQIGFASRRENPNYGIMYWDEVSSNWIRLKDFQSNDGGASVSFPLHASNQQDEYKVLSGAHLVIDGNRYREEITTNFPGIFLLAQQ